MPRLHFLSGDQISKDLMSYVEKETLNPSSKKYFSQFAQELSAIQDYRNAEVYIGFITHISC